MQELSIAKDREIWLDHEASHHDAATARRQALLFQLCGKGALWRHGHGYMFCTLTSRHVQKDGREYNKFLQLLYIQGIIQGGFEAGAYPGGPHAFEVRLSSAQLRQMREYYLALFRLQKTHKKRA